LEVRRDATETLRINLGSQSSSLSSTLVDKLPADVESAAGRLEAIDKDILLYISIKTRRRSSAETILNLLLDGKSIEEMLVAIIPDAIALDRSRQSERGEQVHIKIVVEFGK
jgi:hypothetical protein